MKIGFAGSSEEMTSDQYVSLMNCVMSLRSDEFYFHHKRRNGSDQQFHDMIFFNTNGTLIIHPQKNKENSFFIPHNYRVVTLPYKDYLNGDKEIIDSVELLLIAVKKKKISVKDEEINILRYCRSQRVDFILFMPDGTKIKNKVNRGNHISDLRKGAKLK